MFTSVRTIYTSRIALEAARKSVKKSATGAASKASGTKAVKDKKEKPKTKTELKNEEKPKAPKNAYQLYLTDQYSKVKATLPESETKFGDMSKKISELWKKETENVKSKYVSVYEKEHAKYAEDLKKWKEKWAKPLTGYQKFIKSEIKNGEPVTSKDEAVARIRELAAKWKSLSDSEKTHWKSSSV